MAESRSSSSRSSSDDSSNKGQDKPPKPPPPPPKPSGPPPGHVGHPMPRAEAPVPTPLLDGGSAPPPVVSAQVAIYYSSSVQEVTVSGWDGGAGDAEEATEAMAAAAAAALAPSQEEETAELRAHLAHALNDLSLLRVKERCDLVAREVDKREVLCVNESALRRAMQSEFCAIRRLFLQENLFAAEVRRAEDRNAALQAEISTLAAKVGEASAVQSALYAENLYLAEKEARARQQLAAADVEACALSEPHPRAELALREARRFAELREHWSAGLLELQDDKLRRVFEEGEMRLLAERVVSEQGERDAAVLALRHEAETTLEQLACVLQKKEAALRQISDLLAENGALEQRLASSRSEVDHLTAEKIQLNQKIAALRLHNKREAAERGAAAAAGGAASGVAAAQDPSSDVVAVADTPDVAAIVSQREARSLAVEITNLRKAGRAVRRDLEEAREERTKARAALEKKAAEAEALAVRLKDLQKRYSRSERSLRTLREQQGEWQLQLQQHALEQDTLASQQAQEDQALPARRRSLSTVVPAQFAGTAAGFSSPAAAAAEENTSPPRSRPRAPTAARTSPVRSPPAQRSRSEPPSTSPASPAAVAPAFNEGARLSALRELLADKEGVITVLRGEVEKGAGRLEVAHARVRELEVTAAARQSEARVAAATSPMKGGEYGGGDGAVSPSRVQHASMVLRVQQLEDALREETESGVRKDAEIEDTWLQLDSKKEELALMRAAKEAALLEAEKLQASPPARLRQEGLEAEVAALRHTTALLKKKTTHYEAALNELKGEREALEMKCETLGVQLADAHQCAAGAASEINSIVLERGLEKERYNSIITDLESRARAGAASNASLYSGTAHGASFATDPNGSVHTAAPAPPDTSVSHQYVSQLLASIAEKDSVIEQMQEEVNTLHSQLRTARYRLSQQKAVVSGADDAVLGGGGSPQSAAAAAASTPRLVATRSVWVQVDEDKAAALRSRSRSRSLEAPTRAAVAAAEGEASRVREALSEQEAVCARLVRDAKEWSKRERLSEKGHAREVTTLQEELDAAVAALMQTRQAHIKEVAELRLNAERLSARADARQAKVRELQALLRGSKAAGEPESIVLEESRASGQQQPSQQPPSSLGKRRPLRK